MAIKMFRKLIMISAVLFLLVSGTVNAGNQCTDKCVSQFNACYNAVWDFYIFCINNTPYEQCMEMCKGWGGSQSYCEEFCDPYYWTVWWCENEANSQYWVCVNTRDNCIDACF